MTGSTRSGCSTARWCTRGAPVRLRTRSAREGTQVHSADPKDALCTSGALASRGAGGETLLPFAVDDARLRGATRRAVRGSGSARCRGGLHRSLGGVDGQSRAQLDGFKSRALRPEAPAQRHLYATEWRVLAATPAPAQGRPAALVLGDAALPFEDERVPSRTRWNELELDLEPGVMTLVV
ncbi:polyketide synthase [Chrysochromulina tobinii]|uniref:Polyketide synthase n=1 Tax=Chrysochromulina tobinii TaxID=1460289 RepID=A0A0M0JP02_9EUKA|nr:polyketide synthase [Chrysochromulina tobinii]|eukprot:KOO28331.1 polyketide synthase [Chrysochromulina sp. CCMP291]